MQPVVYWSGQRNVLALGGGTQAGRFNQLNKGQIDAGHAVDIKHNRSVVLNCLQQLLMGRRNRPYTDGTADLHDNRINRLRHSNPHDVLKTPTERDCVYDMRNI